MAKQEQTQTAVEPVKKATHKVYGVRLIGTSYKLVVGQNAQLWEGLNLSAVSNKRVVSITDTGVGVVVEFEDGFRETLHGNLGVLEVPVNWKN